MTIKNSAFFTIELDSTFEWELNGLEPIDLLSKLVKKQDSVAINGKKDEKPKASLGFGLKKKPAPTEHSTSTDLIIELPIENLQNELTNQFKISIDQLNFAQPFVHVISFGTITHKRKSLPLLMVPVQLNIDPSLEVPFILKWTFDTPFFNADVQQILSDFDIETPQIPSNIQDISIEELVHDLTYKLPEDAELKFKLDSFIYKITFNFLSTNEDYTSVQAEPTSQIDENHLVVECLNSSDLGLFYELTKQEQPYKHVEIPFTTRNAFIKNIASIKSSNNPVVISLKRKADLDKLNASFKNQFGVLSIHDLKTPDSINTYLSHYFDEKLQTSSEPNYSLNYKEALNRLENYDKALNNKENESDWSAAELMALLASLKETKVIYKPEKEEFTDLSSTSLTQRKSFLKQVLKLESQVVSNPVWEHANLKVSIEELVEELKNSIQKISNSASTIDDLSNQIQSILGIPVPKSLELLVPFLDKFKFLQDIPSFERYQLDQNWHPIPSIIFSAIDLIGVVKKEIKRTEQNFHKEVLHEQLEQIIPEIEPILFSPKRFIDWRFKQHSKRLLKYSRVMNQKFDTTYLAHLRDVIKVRNKIKELNDMNSAVAKYVGSYWQGYDTDLVFLNKQIKWFEDFSKVKLEFIDEDIDRLKKLIIRKDSASVVNKIKDLKNKLGQTDLIEKKLNDALGLTDVSLFKFADESGKTIEEFLTELIESVDSIKQSAMLARLKDSEQGKKLHTFLEFIKPHNLPIDQVIQVYEFSLLKAQLAHLESENPLLTSIESSDIKRMVEMIDSNYKELVDKSIFDYNTSIIELRKSSTSKKKIKDAINYLKHVSETEQVQLFHDYLHQIKDAILSSSRIILCNPNQLEAIVKELSPTLITDFYLDKASISGNVNESLVLTYDSNHSISNPKDIVETKITKAQQVKGEISTEFIVSALDHSLQQDVVYVLPTEKAEHAFWYKLTHNALDFNSKYQHLNTNEYHFSTRVETAQKQLEVEYQFDKTYIDYSFIDPKLNPFALKKSSTKQLQDAAQSALAFSNTISLIKNEGDKSEEVSKKSSYLLESSKWSISSESLIHAQLSKATFLNENPVTSSDNPLEAWVKTKDNRLGYIWSDFTDSKSSLANKIVDLSALQAKMIFNPIKKVYSKSDSLLFDVLDFIKKEQSKEIDTNSKKVSTSKNKPEQIPLIVNPATTQKEPLVNLVQTLDPFSDPVIPSEFSFNEIANSSKPVKPKHNKLPKIKQFQPHEISILGEPDQFFTITGRSLKKLIIEIIQKESPIHWHRLTRLVVASWQMERISENALIITKKIISELVEKNELYLKQGILYDNAEYKFTVRSRKSIVDFNADEIPFVELEMALFLVLDQYYPVILSDLLQAASFLLGFEELTTSLETVLKRALIKMGIEDVVSISEKGFQLTRPVLL